MTTPIFQKFAARYAQNYGLSVFPCKPKAKVPLTKSGFKEATSDLEKIVEWADKWPDANIGIATGDVSGIWVLDIDNDIGEQWLATMPPLPVTPEVKTSKGRHIYFKLAQGCAVPNSAGHLSQHVDVRGNGGYVIAPPSAHPDGEIFYQWHPEKRPVDVPFVEAPEWLLHLVIKKPYEAKEPVQEPVNYENADRYVKRVLDEEFRLLATASQGTRNDQLFKSVAAMSNYIGKGGATSSMVHSLAVAGAQANGLWQDDGPDHCMSTIQSALKTGLAKPKDIPAPKQYERERVRPALSIVDDSDAQDNDWTNELLRSGKDDAVIKKSLHNGLITLEKHPAMRNVLIYNAFADLVMLIECPPWESKEGWTSRPIRDDDAIACATWLEKPVAGGLSIRPNDAHHLMLRIAKMREIDPPKDWLQSLEWDKVERLDKWLVDYCEAEDNQYTHAVGRKFMIGAVKRLMEPGCKMDSMLILEGDQGKGKSTALRILATWGKDCYFTDQVDDISNKDALIQIQGVSIIEFAEMDTLNKSDTDHIKKFITRQIDRYRPPYGKTLTDRPRRCVFAGTVNPGGNGYLKDPTGARRFWPVAVNEIDTENLEKMKHHLWAEAYYYWQQGEKNWIDDPEVMVMAVSEQAKRYEEEPWAPIIEREIRQVDAITIQDILAALEIPKDRRDRRASWRVGSYLRHRGWISRKDYRAHPNESPQRRYYAPEGHEAKLEPKVDEYANYV